jgi:hypothetical protein
VQLANPVTEADVLGWFQATMAHHRPHGRMPTPEEVVWIVKVVNLMQEVFGGSDAEDDAKVRRVQVAIKVLRETLPEFLEYAKSWRSPEPFEISISMHVNEIVIGQLLDAATEAAECCFDEPRQGRPTRLGLLKTSFGTLLIRHIQAVWKVTGRRVSLNADGPLVSVLRRAVEAIDGRSHSSKAVAAMLRREERRR